MSPQTDDILHLPPIPAQCSLSELRQQVEIMRRLLIQFAATKAQLCDCDASQISFDGSSAGLSATNVQDAIIEVEGNHT